MEFGEISGREEDEKRGFLGAVGLMLRCVEGVTGIHKDRQTDREAERKRGRQEGRQEDRLRLCVSMF